MLKYVFIFMTIFSFSAAAQMEMHDETIDVEIPAPLEEERNTIYLPSCDDEYLLSQIKDKINEYQESTNPRSIVDKRNRVLTIKNLKSFTEIPIDTFDKKTSYNVSSELVMTKINQQLTNEDMRLCIDNTKIVYLLIYPEGAEGFRVQIINFIPRDADGNKFSILYLPQNAAKE